MKTRIVLLALIVFTLNVAIGQGVNDHQVQYKNKPIIEMTLNGKKTWVLLDTGSSISVLNLKVKEEYNYVAYTNEDRELVVPGFGSEDNTLLYTRKVDLRFGETRLRQRFYAFDFSSVVESIKGRTGKEITAIIGIDTMKSYGFVIDMGNRTVYMNKNTNKRNDNAIASQ